MTNRTCLVTGGGTGLGLAITRRLTADGDDVIIVGRRADVLARAAERLNADTGRNAVSTEVADLTEPDAVAALAERLPERLDVVCHNAGGNPPSAYDDGLKGLEQNWLDTYRLNVVSAVLLQEAVQDRIPDRTGRVVVISSVAALRGAGAYGAAKGALDTWITGLAPTLGRRGVTINAVAPGFVPDTEFWEGRRTDELIASKTAEIPLGRPGTPDEVAALVSHLASPDAGWTTGQVVGIHGGVVLARL